MSEGLKAKMERIQGRAARELARELAAAVEVGDAEFLSYASTATSGIGDEFVFGGIFREAELGRKVADGFRQGAATRNGPAKKRHPDYQRRAEELWAQDSNRSEEHTSELQSLMRIP